MATPLDILVGIDGSHSSAISMSEEEYDRRFGGSHVRSIVKEFSDRAPKRGFYVRGPSGLGFGVSRAFEESLDGIQQAAAGAAAVRLHLVGFSRGAAIALDLANAFAQPARSPLTAATAPTTAEAGVATTERLRRVRASLEGKVTVASLGLFDAVDMSQMIVGAPIAAGVGRSALVRRSTAWGSRLGWDNVGDTWEPGPGKGRERIELHGTHGAMGGQPGQGDIPRPLARELLRTLSREEDWDLVERRYLEQPLRHAIVEAAKVVPGIYVHPENGGFLKRAAFEANRVYRGSVVFVRQAAIGANMTIEIVGRGTGSGLLQTRRIIQGAMRLDLYRGSGQMYRTMMRIYAAEGAGPYGATNMELDTNLGSFATVDVFFRDFKPCLDVIDAYRRADAKASEESLAFVLKHAMPGH